MWENMMPPGQEEDWRGKIQNVRMLRYIPSPSSRNIVFTCRVSAESPRLVMSTAAEIQIHA